MKNKIPTIKDIVLEYEGSYIASMITGVPCGMLKNAEKEWFENELKEWEKELQNGKAERRAKLSKATD
jgi:hypothetical protein